MDAVKETTQDAKQPAPALPVFPLTITLKRPVKFGGEQLTALTLHEPRAGDLRAIGDSSKFFATCLDFGAELAELPAEVIDRLYLADANALVAAVSPFLYGSPATGTI